MGFAEELRSHWAAFAVLFFANGMKNLVNQVEVAFARSLVSCTEPLSEVYTGSQWCGDRLEVISVGYSISQRGQAQESFAMLISILMVAVLGSVFGRKVVLLVGLFGTTISVAFFILACAMPSWSRVLFVMGQGLQGLLPIGHLAGLIIFDISVKGGGMATYQVKGLLDTIGGLLWGPVLGNFVQYLELVNYSTVWTVIFLINLSVLSAAAFLMPESMDRTKAEKDGEVDTTSGSFSKVMREVLSYKDVYYNPLSWRFLLMVCIEPCWTHVFGMIPIQLMAYHGWSQSAVTMLILLQPLFLVFMGIVPSLCLRLSYTFMMPACLVYLYTVLILQQLTIAVSDVLPIMMFLAFTLMGGFMPLKEYVDSRFSTPDEIARFKSVEWVIGYVLGMGIGPVYASVFDASAATYISRSIPNFLACTCMIIQCLHVRFIMYPYMTVTLGLMDELEHKQKEVFLALTQGDSPLDQEAWQAAALEKHLGKSFEEAQGPFQAIDGFREFCKKESGGTNAETKTFIAKLDAALASLGLSESKKAQ
eukprot:s2229_g5.t1